VIIFGALPIVNFLEWLLALQGKRMQIGQATAPRFLRHIGVLCLVDVERDLIVHKCNID
jgi:hypothetical protein